MRQVQESESHIRELITQVTIQEETITELSSQLEDVRTQLIQAMVHTNLVLNYGRH